MCGALGVGTVWNYSWLDRARLMSALSLRIMDPWFGAGRTGQAQPKHGAARITPWDFDGSTMQGDSVTAVYSLPAQTFPGRAFGLALRYEVTFGPELELKLTVINQGDETTSFEEALHTYLAVDDIRGVRIEGLDGASYVDHAGAKTEKTQMGEVVFTGQAARVYVRGATVILHGAAGGRALKIAFEGATNTVCGIRGSMARLRSWGSLMLPAWRGVD